MFLALDEAFRSWKHSKTTWQTGLSASERSSGKPGRSRSLTTEVRSRPSAPASHARWTRPNGLTAVAWGVAAGIAGFALSIVLGTGATMVAFNPDEGATFIAIWFWVAGPPVSALAMAAAARWRRWDTSQAWLSAAVAFAVCLGCGLFAISTRVPPPVPPSDRLPLHPPVTPLPTGGEHTR